MVLKALKKIKEDMICPPKVGEIIEAKFLNRGKSSLFFDLGAKGIGIVYGKELLRAKDVVKNLKPDDAAIVKVIALETDDGYRELSLAEANQEMSWEQLIQTKEKGEILEVQVKSANKGGLVCPVNSIPAFLPASQLSPENYPKVEGAEPAKIAQELQKLVGKKLNVKILDVNPAEKKLILSEKLIKKDRAEEELLNYKVGDIVEGEISGVTNFGVFLKFGNNLEGLIHASEIPSQMSDDSPSKPHLGQKAKVKIIAVNEGRVYLSMKDLNGNSAAENSAAV
jgi:small subunit ribosomal protein S1